MLHQQVRGRYINPLDQICVYVCKCPEWCACRAGVDNLNCAHGRIISSIPFLLARISKLCQPAMRRKGSFKGRTLADCFTPINSPCSGLSPRRSHWRFIYDAKEGLVGFIQNRRTILSKYHRPFLIGPAAAIIGSLFSDDAI